MKDTCALIAVKDIEKDKKFYCDVLGLTIVGYIKKKTTSQIDAVTIVNFI